jgi:quercetin dioxygenase-like cupin family protein
MSTIKTEIISEKNPERGKKSIITFREVMPGEIEGVIIESVTIKGPNIFRGLAQPDIYTVFLSLEGKAVIEVEGEARTVGGEFIARIPYNSSYIICVEKDSDFSFLRILKILDQNDIDTIYLRQIDHSAFYIKAIDDCPKYTEEIKSSKTVNRMILPEGMVPRFCMGSVRTEGPDEVGEHEHPMLDQLFLGMEGCRCLCKADGKTALLTGNLILHIPPGSRHSVSVEEGDTLSYIWMDFFPTPGGQKYIKEQHKMDD